MRICRKCSGEAHENPYLKKGLSKDTIDKTLKHPCFNKEAHNYARIHLPVAPACNIKCKFCDRRYDCQNESRPGVTSNILTPEEALDTFEYYHSRVKNLSVIGIAGPGDALANFSKTKKTIQLVKNKYPDIAVCLSTNGLMLPEYALELKKLGVTHLTITINAVDPFIGEKIYDYIYYKNQKIEGRKGFEILLNNQLEGLKIIDGLDIMCKVNIVAIKEINDFHIKDIVLKVNSLGVTLTNIMSLIPINGTDFEDHEILSMEELEKLRKDCQPIVDQMCHCRQCRADAVGQLGNDIRLDNNIRWRSTAVG